MKKILGLLGVLLLIAPPLWARDSVSGCGRLCGQWVLDTTNSESAPTVVDAALAEYKAPKARKQHGPRMSNPVAQADADAEASLKPMFDRPFKDALRTQLLKLLTPPASLAIRADGDEVVIRAGEGLDRRVFPGEPHSHVDSQGTAKIRTEWKKNELAISEKYDRQHEQTDTYSPLPNGTMQVTKVVDRPGVKTVRLQALYRRD